MNLRLLWPVTLLAATACSDGSSSQAGHGGDGTGPDASADAPVWPETGAADGSLVEAADGDAVNGDAPSIPPAGPAVLVANDVVPDTHDAKLPSIAADTTTVVLGATTGEQANVWEKPVLAAGFAPPETLGEARGQPDYATTSLFLAADGSLHAVWIDQTEPTCTIHYRVKSPGASWGSARVVVAGTGFRVFADVVDTSGGALVVWDENERIRYALSNDQGATWTAPTTTVDAWPGGVPDVALLTGGAPVLVHAWEDVFVERWSGDGFVRETIPRASPEDFHADASIAVTADGGVIVAARNVQPRVLVAERDSSGTWASSVPFSEPVTGRVSVATDPYGGAHLAWASPEGTPPGVRYAYRPPGGSWQQPVVAPIDHFHNGAWIAVSASTEMRVHVVTEDFGDAAGLQLRLMVFAVQ